MDKFQLFKWQQEAINSSVAEDSYGLFADPGTGKTYAALRIAMQWTKTAIVICPLSLKVQWDKESHRVGYTTHIYHYEQLRSKKFFDEIVRYLQKNPTTLILDESHRIKSPSTQTTKAALKLAPFATKRLALTGTPTANSPADLYTQMKFLQPNKRMESFRDFQLEYIEALPSHHPLVKRVGGYAFIPKRTSAGALCLKNIEKLKERMHTYGCTVQLTDVVELPERSFMIKYCTPSNELLRTYKEFKKNCIAKFKEEELTASNAAVLAGRLVRLTSGLGHADFEVTMANPKFETLLEDLDQYVAVGKVIIWSVWVEERRAVYDKLFKQGYNVVIEPTEFMEGDANILVASPKMFGTGLNLQAATYQLWLSRSWSLLEREQALARNYRAGQDKKTIVIDYVTESTIDERVLLALENKTDLLKQIMETKEI